MAFGMSQGSTAPPVPASVNRQCASRAVAQALFADELFRPAVRKVVPPRLATTARPSHRPTAPPNRSALPESASRSPGGWSLAQTANERLRPGGTGVLSCHVVSHDKDCFWTASAAVGWLTIVGSDTGEGPGTINYVVAPLTNGASRTGRITVDSF